MRTPLQRKVAVARASVDAAAAEARDMAPGMVRTRAKRLLADALACLDKVESTIRFADRFEAAGAKELEGILLPKGVRRAKR